MPPPPEHSRTSVSIGRARRHRPVDQRLATRVPRLLQAITSRVRSLPLRSRLRSAFVARSVRLGFQAYNRQDWDALLAPYHPEVAIRIHHIAAIEGDYHGHAGWRRYWQLWFDSWAESYQEPLEVLDFSDQRVLILGRIHGRGRASGLELEEPVAFLLTFRGGAIVHHEEWFDHAAGLEAVGLPA